ncbi:hypothetical protein O181_031278 [Austropuccinia psidii MF-1]|uniref:Uncharacterized protein n=1 Tax=Austropuccinia psidii MF-1 TaxID=1389203 RepID=A0A9Q3CZC5_9BASI|nr:hypothetical protein [Austropuccinia psidii MF-1]
MPIISDPELEPSMSSSNKYKSHSEVSDRHIHDPIITVLYSVQGKGLGNVSTNPPRSDELLENPEKVSQRGGNDEILQWMESTIIQTSNQKHKRLAQQEKGDNQGRRPSSFYQKASIQPTSQKKKEEQEKELEETIFPSLQDSKNTKGFHGQCQKYVQNIDGIQGKKRNKE